MKRWIGVLAALVLAVVLAETVVPSVCDLLEPGTWMYWIASCEKDSAGGGGGGAK